MRAIGIASLTLTCAVALAIAAPAAHAASGASADEESSNVTSFGFTVTPEDIAPGGTVTLNATDCESPLVTASSGVFDAVTLSEGLPGTATVSEDAEPGTEYDVVFDCEGERGTTTLSVSGPGARPSSSIGPHSQVGTHPTTGPRTPSVPIGKPDGGVRAGAGGSLPGLEPAHVVLGSFLIVAAVGGGVVLLRRRSGDPL
ncbi:hypothetical protein ACFQ61_24360 [Streptomyces sp. NPDC056500]|uniref:hypothetical protein n=1 Tax=Streptomyces sp. NPDC056500 TaxID=3345840 RepID=UPI003688A660